MSGVLSQIDEALEDAALAATGIVGRLRIGIL
jgi:hypothetical protein